MPNVHVDEKGKNSSNYCCSFTSFHLFMKSIIPDDPHMVRLQISGIELIAFQESEFADV